jgi:hypothetical protein
MKPKNRVFCVDCGRSKILFETEKKATNFIHFNAKDIHEESGYSPDRSYYCKSCGGWHVTSAPKKSSLPIQKVIGEECASPKILEDNNTIEAITETIKSEIRAMTDYKDINAFLANKIDALNFEVQELKKSDAKGDIRKTKVILKTIHIAHILKKQNNEFKHRLFWLEKRSPNNIDLT